MRYDHHMAGIRVHQANMEAGERWMLNDVTGKAIRAWDSRGLARRMTYDQLRRLTELFVTENGTNDWQNVPSTAKTKAPTTHACVSGLQRLRIYSRTTLPVKTRVRWLAPWFSP